MAKLRSNRQDDSPAAARADGAGQVVDHTVQVEDGAVPVEDGAPWWSDAVIYQVYPRSFSDSNGDGIGDLGGVLDRLGYLELLGVDALWLGPIFASPQVDNGYDISNYYEIDPLFGDIESFRELLESAHYRGLRVLVDLVPNHTSSEHPWFIEALESAPGSAARERYIFRDGRGEHGELPPNNWQSIFGGPAWTRVESASASEGGSGSADAPLGAQWYLHLFAPQQPDLNWENPEVADEFDEIIRHWLDEGVDGFRVDIAHGLAKPDGLPDLEDDVATFSPQDLRFNNPGVHDILRRFRSVVDEYEDRVLLGEVFASTNEALAAYTRPDELHLAFDFRFTVSEPEARQVQKAISATLATAGTHSATPIWTLSNHDLPREVSRYGGGAEGLAAARALAVAELALPGTVVIYQGAELGLPAVTDFERNSFSYAATAQAEGSDPNAFGRDHSRLPLPWENEAEHFGFSTTEPWLPQPSQWGELTVENQLEDLRSTLSLYRAAIDLRRSMQDSLSDDLQWYGAPDGAFAFQRGGQGEFTLVCALNTGPIPIPLPPGELLLVSAELEDGMLPPRAAAWIVPAPLTGGDTAAAGDAEAGDAEADSA